MKMGFIALGLVFLICISLITFNIHLSQTIENMNATIIAINDCIEEKDYIRAENHYIKLKNQWKKSEKTIHFLVNSDELDNINEIFSEIDSFFERKLFEDFFKTVYRLDYNLKHLYEKNQLTIETVF